MPTNRSIPVESGEHVSYQSVAKDVSIRSGRVMTTMEFLVVDRVTAHVLMITHELKGL